MYQVPIALDDYESFEGHEVQINYHPSLLAKIDEIKQKIGVAEFCQSYTFVQTQKHISIRNFPLFKQHGIRGLTEWNEMIACYLGMPLDHWGYTDRHTNRKLSLHRVNAYYQFNDDGDIVGVLRWDLTHAEEQCVLVAKWLAALHDVIVDVGRDEEGMPYATLGDFTIYDNDSHVAVYSVIVDYLLDTVISRYREDDYTATVGTHHSMLTFGKFQGFSIDWLLRVEARPSH